MSAALSRRNALALAPLSLTMLAQPSSGQMPAADMTPGDIIGGVEKSARAGGIGVTATFIILGLVDLDPIDAIVRVLADSGAIGLEIAEFEDGWSGAQAALKGADAPCTPDALLDALAPLTGAAQHSAR